jgi:hypothetical protein
MRVPELTKDVPVEGEDVTRLLTFTSFWGSIFYLLSCVSIVAGTRRPSVRLHTPTLGVAYLLHVLSFVVGGSLVTFIGALVQGKSSTAQSKEAIGGGALERGWAVQALGGAAGAVVPFALAVASQAVAEQITGEPALAESDSVSWPIAGGAMVALSGATALAVARITAWVAEDAKSGG